MNSKDEALLKLKAKSIFKRQLSIQRDLKMAVRGETARSAIGKLANGCEIYGFTKGQFSLIDILEHCIQQTGPADVVICTWSAASGDIRAANRLLSNGRIKGLRFIVDFSFKSRKPKFCEDLIKTFGADCIRVTSIHAKFCLIRNKNWNLVIRTSMNLNFNPRFENFEISDDLAMADFMEGIVSEIWDTQERMVGFTNRPYDNKREFSSMYVGDEIESVDPVRDLMSCTVDGDDVWLDDGQNLQN